MNLAEKHTGKFTRTLGMEVGLEKKSHTKIVKPTELNKAMRKQAENAFVVFIRHKQPVLFGVTYRIKLRDEKSFYILLK